MCVHTEDWHVDRVNELGLFPLLEQSNPHHANCVALFIMSARSVQKYLITISTLGDQWEFKVGRLVSL